MIDIEMIGAPSFTVAVDREGFTYTDINLRLLSVVGVDRGDFVGKRPHEVLSRDFADIVVSQYTLCVNERRSVDFEGFYVAPNGGRWWQTTVSPVFDGGENGRVVALIGVAVDITPRKEAERRKGEVEARLSLAMDVLEGGFWHYSIDKRQFKASPQLAFLVRGRADEPLDIAGFSASIQGGDDGSPTIQALIQGEGDIVGSDYRVVTLDGTARWLSCKRRVTCDEAGRPENVIGVVVDITEQKLRQDYLAAQAATDSLTELSNRRGFEALGAQLVSRWPPQDREAGLILLDLDRFKPVNDTYGHAIGDVVLREVAARLRRHIRPGDTAARLGGDEFAILVAHADKDLLAAMALRLVATMARPIVTEAGLVEIGASIGAATWRPEDGDLAGLMLRADEALIAVKRSRRGTWRVAD